MDKVQALNELWHIVGMRMKSEMCSGKYPAILSISMIELSILETVERYPNREYGKYRETKTYRPY